MYMCVSNVSLFNFYAGFSWYLIDRVYKLKQLLFRVDHVLFIVRMYNRSLRAVLV